MCAGYRNEHLLVRKSIMRQGAGEETTVWDSVAVRYCCLVERLPAHHGELLLVTNQKTDPPGRYLFVAAWQSFFLSKTLNARRERAFERKNVFTLESGEHFFTDVGWVHK